MSTKSVVKKQVELSEINVQRFHDMYDGLTNKASLSWILDLLLEKFLEAHVHSPAEMAAIGAAELRKIVESN